jgi:hypothetical protein
MPEQSLLYHYFKMLDIALTPFSMIFSPPYISTQEMVFPHLTVVSIAALNLAKGMPSRA